jgi:hypothetical protein
LARNLTNGLRRTEATAERVGSTRTGAVAATYLPLADAIASTPVIGIVQSMPSLMA